MSPRYSDQERAEAKALMVARDERRAKRKSIRGELFDKQLEVMDAWLSGTRFMALCCSRRAGKTQLIARMVAIALMGSGRGEWVVFCAATFGVAKNIVWDELVALGNRHELGWRCVETDCTITTTTGAKFRLVGVDDKKQIEKIRGLKYRLVVLDEASTYQDKLHRLYNDVVRPGLIDLNGSLVLSGTPGYVCAGYWFDAASGALHYRNWHWTLRDNPHIKDADTELAAIRADKKCTEEDPTYKREYLGLWVNDEGSLVYGGYLRTRNRVELTEKFVASEWMCTLAADYGMVDAAALTVIGSRIGDEKVYVLRTRKYVGLLPDEMSAEMAALVEEFRPVAAVGDAGGLGKTFVVEWNRRHARDAQITLENADKADKLASIHMVNSAFRSEHLFLTEGADELDGEIQFLPWADQARTKEHPAYANHASDTLLYGYKRHCGYAFVKRPEAQPPPHQKWTTVDQRKERNRKRSQTDWWDT